MRKTQTIRPNFHPAVLFIGVVVCMVAVTGVMAMAWKAKNADKSRNSTSAAARLLPPLPAGAERTVTLPPHEWRGTCPTCHISVRNLNPWAQNGQYQGKFIRVEQSAATSNVPPQGLQAAGNPWGTAPPAAATERGFSQQAAGALPQGGRLVDILSPAEQNAAGKALFEGHWLGMELMDLSAVLRRIYKIPDNVTGVIVDEVTLESAESGILAGDVVAAINGWRTGNLSEFFQATMRVSGEKKADVIVCRLGGEKRFTLTTKNSPTLGFVQMEAAAPIRPGAISPHKNRREACTACHVFMTTGGQLPTDAGDILPSPPPIAANDRAPHAYKGVCNTCHQIIK